MPTPSDAAKPRTEDAAALWRLVQSDDRARVAPEAAAELLRQAEARHESLYRAALGLDQRATVAGAAFLATAAALIAAAAAAPDLRWPSLASALLFVAAGALSFHAARPVEIRMPGVHPAAFLSGNMLGDVGVELRLALAAEVTYGIQTLDAVQTKNARILRDALRAAAVAPLAGALAAALLLSPS